MKCNNFCNLLDRTREFSYNFDNWSPFCHCNNQCALIVRWFLLFHFGVIIIFPITYISCRFLNGVANSCSGVISVPQSKNTAPVQKGRSGGKGMLEQISLFILRVSCYFDRNSRWSVRSTNGCPIHRDPFAPGPPHPKLLAQFPKSTLCLCALTVMLCVLLRQVPFPDHHHHHRRILIWRMKGCSRFHQFRGPFVVVLSLLSYGHRTDSG